MIASNTSESNSRSFLKFRVQWLWAAQKLNKLLNWKSPQGYQPLKLKVKIMLPISQAAYISDKNVGKKFFSKLFESINSTKVEIEGVQFKSDSSAPEQLYIDRYKLVSVR